MRAIVAITESDVAIIDIFQLNYRGISQHGHSNDVPLQHQIQCSFVPTVGSFVAWYISQGLRLSAACHHKKIKKCFDGLRQTGGSDPLNLTQAEADALIAMEKHRVNDDRIGFPTGGSP